MLGSTVDLISRSLLHTIGFLVRFFWPMSSLGKDSEAIVYTYLFISQLALSQEGNADPPEQSWGQYSLIDTWRHLPGDCPRELKQPCVNTFFPKTHKKLYPYMSLSNNKSLLCSRFGNRDSCSCSYPLLCKSSKTPQGLFCCWSTVWKWNSADRILAPSFNWIATRRVWVKDSGLKQIREFR